jgi:hypothetical protein
LGGTGDGTANSNRADMHNLTEQQQKDVVWLDGYRHGATDARTDDEIEKQKMLANERQRIVTLLESFSDHPVIQQVIELIYKK